MEIVVTLLEHGATIRIPSTFELAKKYRSSEIYDFLCENKDLALRYAIATKDKASFLSLTALPSFDPNATHERNTLLIFALRNLGSDKSNHEFLMFVVRSLLSVPGIDIRAKGNEEWTALDYAVLVGLDFVKLLLRYNAPISIPSTLKLAEEKGAPGVHDFFKAQKFLPGDDNSQVKHKSLLLPPGQYTYQEAMKAQQQRYDRFAKESANKNCARCQKADCTSKCSKCKKVYYCCRDCQIAHWPAHKAEAHVPGDCSICLELVADARQEECGHQFHESCINKWKEGKIKPLCPLCSAYL